MVCITNVLNWSIGGLEISCALLKMLMVIILKSIVFVYIQFGQQIICNKYTLVFLLMACGWRK